MIDGFGGMGFDVEHVVAAFQSVGAERRGGQDYKLDEGKINDITARLLGEWDVFIDVFIDVHGFLWQNIMKCGMLHDKDNILWFFPV